MAHSSDKQGRTETALLAVLAGLCLGLHLVHFISVPLAFEVDSASYLKGALTFARTGSLEGVPPHRGPVLPMVLGTLIRLSGGHGLVVVKGFFHTLAFFSVFLAYGICRMLFNACWQAFACALACAFFMDRIYYSSLVLSEVAAGFFALLLVYLALRALLTAKPVWFYLYAAALPAAVLLRPENLVFVLVLPIAWAEVFRANPEHRRGFFLKSLALVLAGAFLILAWCGRNQDRFGFFGLTHYRGVVLYDGFLIRGHALGLDLADPDIPSVAFVLDSLEKRKQQVDDPLMARALDFPGSVYAHWMALYHVRGLTHSQAIAALEKAAVDAIRKRPGRALWLVWEKILHGMAPPQILRYFTQPLGLEPRLLTVESFDAYLTSLDNQPYRFAAHGRAPESLVRFQRRINQAYLAIVTSSFFRFFWYGALLGFFLLPSKKPRLAWTCFCLMVFFKTLLPLALAAGIPRNMAPGSLLYLILVFAFWARAAGLGASLLKGFLHKSGHEGVAPA